MESIVDRAYRMGIHKDQTVFLVTMEDLLNLVDDNLDTEDMTSEELQESINFIKRALDNLNLYSFLQSGLNSVVIGGSQVRVARAGAYPCDRCPDSLLGRDGSCQHEDSCKAWGIYSNQY
jgi:hypothetical protein